MLSFPRQLNRSHANDVAPLADPPDGPTDRPTVIVRSGEIDRSAASNLRKRNNVMLSSHHYSARICGQLAVQPCRPAGGNSNHLPHEVADGRTDGRGAPDANNLNQHHLISPKLMIVRCSSVCSLPLVRGHHLHQMITSVGQGLEMQARACATNQRFPCRW